MGEMNAKWNVHLLTELISGYNAFQSIRKPATLSPPIVYGYHCFTYIFCAFLGCKV